MVKSLTSDDLISLMDHPNPGLFKIKLNAKNKLFDFGEFYNIPTEVNERDSILFRRNDAIKNILASYHASFATKEREIITIERVHRDIELFIKWANTNSHWNIFGSDEDARVAILNYTKYLEALERGGKIATNTAVRRQSAAIETINSAANEEINLQGVILLSEAGYKRSKPTELPDDENLTKALSLSDALFNQIADFIIDFAPYPFILKLPEESCWVFPSKSWIMPKFKLSIREGLHNPSWTWNFEDGSIQNIDYLKTKYNFSDSAINKSITRAKRTLNESNNFPRHHSRLNLGAFACRAFLFLFDNIVGANRSFYEKLQWEDEYIITKAGKKGEIDFVSIKSRAKRKVKFCITKEFVEPFKKYLKLRELMMGDHSTNKLFFQLDKKFRPTQITPQFHQIYFEQIQTHIDPNISTISNRRLRARKGDHLQNTTSPEISAKLLQNTINTAQRNYASGSESKHSIEITKYFEHVKKRIIKEEDLLTEKLHKISIGVCSHHLNPIATDKCPPAIPDCKNPEGCLWCENYLLHADHQDVHKLLSMKYVIKEIAPLVFKSSKLTAGLYQSIARIDMLIAEISSMSQETNHLVNKTIKEVESGNLTEYWEWKLTQLYNMGVIN